MGTSPATAVVEQVVARWIVELLGLPSHSSVGLVTGCQMASFTALTCARDAVLSFSLAGRLPTLLEFLAELQALGKERDFREMQESRFSEVFQWSPRQVQ